MSSVLGIDLGTTETKVGLFDLEGRPLAFSRAGYAIQMPRPGWAEQDVEEWWTAIAGAVRQAVQAAGGKPPLALAIAGQGPTIVVADDRRQALRPAMTWMDTRTAAEAVELQTRLGQGPMRLGVLPAALWLARHEPEVTARARYYLMSWDYLAYRLSGVAVAAVPDPERALPVEMAHEAGIEGGRLGRPVTWGSVLGPLLPDVADELGLPVGVPVVAGANDAMATFIGAGLRRAGQAVDTGGTSGGFAVYWGEPVEVSGVFAGPAPVGGLWLYGGAMSATGKSLDWVAGILGGNSAETPGRPDVESLLAEASDARPGAEGLLFLPYLAGERSPIWDEGARGALVGLTLRHERGHIVRAVIEAAALSIRHVAEPILAAGIAVNELRVCGGPARSALWNQVKADVTGFAVAVPRVLETATLGAAMLAAIGAGEVGDVVEGMERMTAIERLLQPRPETREVYDALYEAYKAAYPSLRPIFSQLAGVEAATARGVEASVISSGGRTDVG